MKEEMTMKALEEIKENLIIGADEYAKGVCWFMYHLGFWSFDTLMFVIDKVDEGEIPEYVEVIKTERITK